MRPEVLLGLSGAGRIWSPKTIQVRQPQAQGTGRQRQTAKAKAKANGKGKGKATGRRYLVRETCPLHLDQGFGLGLVLRLGLFGRAIHISGTKYITMNILVLFFCSRPTPGSRSCPPPRPLNVFRFCFVATQISPKIFLILFLSNEPFRHF